MMDKENETTRHRNVAQCDRLVTAQLSSSNGFKASKLYKLYNARLRCDEVLTSINFLASIVAHAVRAFLVVCERFLRARHASCISMIVPYLPHNPKPHYNPFPVSTRASISFSLM